MSLARQCQVNECKRKYYGRGYCSMHYQRWVKGKPLDLDRYETNLCIIVGDSAYIILNDRYGNPIDLTVIDTDDLPYVRVHKWCLMQNRYVVSRINGRLIRLHRLITGWDIEDTPHIDHIDGNGLNNRRSNLRRATAAQNNANKRISSKNISGYIGVSWYKAYEKWSAEVRYKNKRYHLGYFVSVLDAAKAYDTKKLELCGEFARLNFPAGK